MERSPAFRLVLLLGLALPACAQITLTGAIQFSTNATGVGTPTSEIWNTLGGDNRYDLWFALDAGASSPVNGPSDSQAGINISLTAGSTYQYYIFGAPGFSTGFNGLNLFFNGNSSAPGVSAFGATNGTSFQPDGNSTLTLASTSVAGSGSTFYRSGNTIAVLTGYNWNAPATPPGDVCQPYLFAPGGGVSLFGSFTLQVFAAASLSSSLSSASPGTEIHFAGVGFAPMETVEMHFGALAAPPFATVTADAQGIFVVTAREPQAVYGPEDVYAVGQTSGNVGAASVSVTPRLRIRPSSGSPGGAATAAGSGFGNGETVNVYWGNPRQLLGTPAANSTGSFVGSNALKFTIPTKAAPGSNAVIAIGQTTGAVAIGKITVE